MRPWKLQEDNHFKEQTARLNQAISRHLDTISSHVLDSLQSISRAISTKIDAEIAKNVAAQKLVERLNPELVLKQGYSIISGKLAPGENVEITTLKQTAKAEIKAVKERK